MSKNLFLIFDFQRLRRCSFYYRITTDVTVAIGFWRLQRRSPGNIRIIQ